MATPRKTDEIKAPDEPKTFEVVEIATETQPVINDVVNDERYDIYSALAKIMNDLESVKKAVL